MRVKNDYLLKRLPPDIVVLNCAHCGRLMASSPGTAAKFRAAGLRCLGGYERVKFHDGFTERPFCVECFAGVPVHQSAYRGRTEGQVAKLRELYR